MSQTQRTSQTITTIDVSQGKETPALSSPPRKEAPVERAIPGGTQVVEDSLDANVPANANGTQVVEDSVENWPAVTTVGPQTRPSQEAEDELYSLTPERPRGKRSQQLPASASPAQTKRKVSNNALDALLTRGATVHKAHERPARQSRAAPIVEEVEDELPQSQAERSAPVGSAAPASAAKRKRLTGNHTRQGKDQDDIDELHSSDDSSAPIGSHSRPSKKDSKTSAALKPLASAKNKMTSKAPQTMGSLAALRQRKGEDAAGPASVVKPGTTSSVLQPRDVSVQASASLASGTKQAPTALASGKLQPVKRGMFAHTPMGKPSSQPKKSLAPVPTQGGVEAQKKASAAEKDDVAVTTGSKVAKEAIESRQSLKRPAKTMKETHEDGDSTYDVPQSSGNEGGAGYQPAKKSRKGKAPQRKRAAAPPSSASATPAQAKRPARRSKARQAKSSPEAKPVEEAAPSKSTRSRMKAESGTVPSASKIKPPVPAAKAASTKPNEVVQSDTNALDAGNDAADFDLPILASGDEMDQAPKLQTHEELVKIKKEKMDGKTGRPSMKEPRGDIQKGASQQDAIELSDAHSSSEDEQSPVPENDHIGAQHTTARARLGDRDYRTPAAMRSSPPVADRPSTKPTTAGLIDPQSARKSTIISFDKFGPRNQGTTSAGRGRPSLTPTDRSSLPPGSAGDSASARLQARPEVHPVMDVKMNPREPSATRSNVASDAQEALAAFMRKDVPQRKPQMNLRDTREDAPSRSRDVSELYNHDENDDFADIDQLGEDTTLMGDQEPSPEPKTRPVGSRKTLSQQQMPPPVSKGKPTRPINRAPVVPSMLQNETQHTRRTINPPAQTNVLGKRHQAAQPECADMPSKRVRAEEFFSDPIDGPGSPRETKVITRKPPAPDHRKEPVQPRAGSQQNVRRQRSQGTVDVHGSPVPEGMVVGELNTVLETFSQQAAISSDKLDADGKTAAGRVTVGSSDHLPLKPAQQRPKRVSSNIKAVPAEPSQDSQAITHVARVLFGKKPFVTTVKTAHPPTDPFTSGEEERNQAAESSGSSTAFSKYLKQMAAQPPADHAGPQQSARNFYWEDEDPEKTLVEPVADEGVKFTYPQRRSKRKVSFESVTSSEGSTDTEDTSASVRDMGVWRAALQSHHMNLFDELVIISHRLVRHLVDEEEATATAIDDFRRRGEELVDQLHAGREQDLRAYYGALKAKKKRLQREMEGVAGRLEDASRRVRAEKTAVRRQQGAGGKVVREGVGVEGLMEAFC